MTPRRIPNQAGEDPKGPVEVLGPEDATPFDPPGADPAAKPKKKTAEPLDVGLLEAAVALFGVGVIADLFDGEAGDEAGGAESGLDLGEGFDI
ncbi:MAG: hypothetical protein FJX65_17855 [Alphaproteobacteria bacterium]|nr:hypothetical protein [Alphaproteobacteria bacterium]